MHNLFLTKNKISNSKIIKPMLYIRIFPDVRMIIEAKWVLILAKISLLQPPSLVFLEDR